MFTRYELTVLVPPAVCMFVTPDGINPNPSTTDWLKQVFVAPVSHVAFIFMLFEVASSES